MILLHTANYYELRKQGQGGYCEKVQLLIKCGEVGRQLAVGNASPRKIRRCNALPRFPRAIASRYKKSSLDKEPVHMRKNSIILSITNMR